MSTYTVKPDVVIGRVEGLSNSYGPGGYAVGTVGPMDSGRRKTGGPLEQGPWGYLVGLASVIDTRGGTGAEHARAREEGRWLDSIADGDVLVIGDNVPMQLHVGHLGHLTLDPVS